MVSVGDAGEKQVLKRVLAQLRPADAALLGPGDDCAILAANGDVVVTSDTMVEGPDFRMAWHGAAEAGAGFDLGWKLAATNLSDVAAMGARPIGLTVSLACPQDADVALLEGIARGLDAACHELAPGCGVVGGDLGTSPVLFAAVTALGDMQGRTPVLRSGAKPGDTIAYAGDLGLAGIGLALLFRESADAHGIATSDAMARLRDQHPAALAAQLAPVAPIAMGAAAAVAGASAMMDVSDGLSLDAERLGEASDVSMRFDSELLERGFGVQRGQQVSVLSMLTGGEDHGLLATFAAGTVLPAGFLEIGAVGDPRSDGVRVLLDGAPFQPRGWDPYGELPPGAKAE
ncbi:thiamine-phosphate kinase [Leucobacter sp. UT-8R-CII-1-4]|uniref:thiamine-phosphate kinase n=1 Tax=Leucobacter sp. UT-8R-CII-1-4 TaxID=3040075 RepID=UPI0024A8428B|nr:thiamine-phosphate kinase [Leucobacter sp. UT-8R-CII-1-4]MDI6023206.1 thiamine-phosphate kinase [Leucobacter sp. UT-8R-CII-1-4]